MERKYLTISALNQYLKAKLDSDVHLQRVYIKGEISNLKKHSSGHYYFTIKDDKSRINAVMFSNYVSQLQFDLEEGMNVLLTGNVSVYIGAGNFQLYVYQIEPDGIGNLYIELERLKKKLMIKGYFDDQHKKSIPALPNKVGIITAYPSAALEDILRIIHERYPICKIYLFPTLVQGKNAYKQIIHSLLKADKQNLDVLILARGGGSLEDLWNFNQEELVKAIYHCNTPIISGVGHEIDTTLVDYVADCRAPTPTAAASKAVPDYKELIMNIDSITESMKKIMINKLNEYKQKMNSFNQNPRLKEPRLIYLDYLHRLTLLNNDLKQVMSSKLDFYRYQNQVLQQSFVNLGSQISKNQKNQLKIYNTKMENILTNQIQNYKMRFNQELEQLNLVNPLSILQRGYAIVENQKQVITSIQEVELDQMIQIQVSDGQMIAQVKEVKE